MCIPGYSQHGECRTKSNQNIWGFASIVHFEKCRRTSNNFVGAFWALAHLLGNPTSQGSRYTNCLFSMGYVTKKLWSTDFDISPGITIASKSVQICCFSPTTKTYPACRQEGKQLAWTSEWVKLWISHRRRDLFNTSTKPADQRRVPAFQPRRYAPHLSS